MRQSLRRLLQGAAAALLLISVVLLVSPRAQSFIIGYFTRIYFGSTTGPQIRWGSAAPTGACVPSTVYLQKVSGQDVGMVWYCPTSTYWKSAGVNRDEWSVLDFGAVCDGVTDDTAAIQAAINAADQLSAKSGTVLWPDRSCEAQTLTVGPVANPFQTGGSVNPPDTAQRFITLKGTSAATSIFRFSGCPATGQWANVCPALVFSKNKYFHLEDFGVFNASGSSIDDLTQWGIYMGGLPSGGTQTLGHTVSRVIVDGFGVNWQIGDTLGGAASDFDMDAVTAQNGGLGMRIQGSNTLDITLSNLLTARNKIGLINYSGNVFITKGSSSFNVIDVLGAGFGPFKIEDYRTEGPGISIVGGEPGMAVKSMLLAEPQGARAIVGDVTATPNDTRTVTGVSVNNSGPAYAITFSSGDITGEDVRKTVLIPNVGAAGATCVARINTVTSLTAGTVTVEKANCIQTASTEDIVLYDQNTCDLTFPADQLTVNDVGAQLSLANSTVPSTWSRNVRAVVTDVTSSTTGTCGFFMSTAGAGPVVNGTSTNPSLFVNLGVLLNDSDGATSTFQNLLFPNGMILFNPVSTNGVITMIGNDLWAPRGWPLTVRITGKQYSLDLNPASLSIAGLPTPPSSISQNTGVLLPWTFVDNTNQGFTGSGQLIALGNRASLNGGPSPWALLDGTWNYPINTDEQLQTIRRPALINDILSLLNPFAPYQFPPVGPAMPTQQLSRVVQLSESGYAGGRNLRAQCTFAAADTCTFTFTRTEAVEIRRGVGSPTTFDPVTRTSGMNVTSGHFSQSDVGKLITVPGCCGTLADSTYFGYITAITSATSITARQIPGGFSFPNGITAVNATVGVDEPDALWLPVGLTCTGLDVANSEVVEVTSWDATGFVLTSSNATSAATCRLLIVR